MKERIYLDSNATTGLDPRVLDAMLPELSSQPSNPSSTHFFGKAAKQRLEQARQTIASVLSVQPKEILFTSSGTEGINALIHGMQNGHIITSNVEHSCIYNTLKTFSEVSFLPAGLRGTITPEHIQNAIKPTTRFIILSAVNNETGVKIDMQAIAKIALAHNIPFFVDGVCLLGKELFEIPPGVTAMAFSGHKIHAPKGTGFLFVRSSLKLKPFITGGEQEFGKRAGTENLAGIIGLAKAVELLNTELPEATTRMALLRDKLEADLMEKANPVIINGQGPRICNTSNLSFPDVSGEDLLIALDMAGIAVSHGSACSSLALEPSRILTEMGIPPKIAKSAIRFSLSRLTTLDEINHTVHIIANIVRRLRGE